MSFYLPSRVIELEVSFGDRIYLSLDFLTGYLLAIRHSRRVYKEDGRRSDSRYMKLYDDEGTHLAVRE